MNISPAVVEIQQKVAEWNQAGDEDVFCVQTWFDVLHQDAGG